MSESSADGKSNPQIHTPAINRVVKFGPVVSKIFLKDKYFLLIPMRQLCNDVKY